MKRGMLYLLSVLVVLSMLLGACSTPTPEAAQPTEPPQPTEAPEPTKPPEPTAEPEPTETPEPVVASPEDLDAAYGALLASMEAYNTIKADALMAEMAEDEPPFLLDVRTTAEVEENGHIEGATHIPLEELAQHTDLLPAFDVPIVTYCGSGWRATIAMTALNAMGWENVRALKTTFAEWVEAGNPVAEGLPENMALAAVEVDPGMLIVFDEMLAVYGVKPFGVIDAEGLNAALVENPGPIVIDVRTAGEVEEKGNIDTGEMEQIHIPLEDLVANREMWPADDAEIVVYCGSGHRSTMAMTILGSYGYPNVSSLKGGFGGWAEGGYPVVGGAAAGTAALDTNYQVMLGSMEAYNTISADALMAEMVEDEPPFLLDVRTSAELEENGHIEGATHIPLEELAQHTDLLPSFDVPIVTYCGSGWRATTAMTALHGMGWTNVRALKTTFAEWAEAGNPVAEGLPENMALNAVEVEAGLLETMDAMLAVYGVKPYGVIDAEGLNAALAENPDLIVMDVRTSGELEEKGVVDTGGAEWIHVPLDEFVVSTEMWPADKESVIAVYCGSGHRSTMAMAILGSYGYSNVSSLKGGFNGWAEGGYPVSEYVFAEDTSAIDANLAAMLGSMEAYNTVKAEDLMAEMVEDEPPFLLDVRTTAEVEENGHIEGATHIPLDELAQHTDLLPAFDVPIVAYCGSGWRATIAMTALHAMGWQDVRALKTTFTEWVDAGNPVAEGLPENMVLDVADPNLGAVSVVDAALSIYGVKPYGVIDAEGLNTALVENPDLIVMDVRTLGEVEEKGVVDTGGEAPVQVPLEEFLTSMEQWPAEFDANIAVYCGSGHRSTMAMTILWLYGYTNVSSLKGGFSGWVEAGYPVAEYAAQ